MTKICDQHTGEFLPLSVLTIVRIRRWLFSVGVVNCLFVLFVLHSCFMVGDNVYLKMIVLAFTHNLFVEDPRGLFSKQLRCLPFGSMGIGLVVEFCFWIRRLIV